jgi:hypothetical protein
MGHEGLWVEFQPLIVLASSAEWLAKNPWRRKVENPVYRFPEQEVCLLHLVHSPRSKNPLNGNQINARNYRPSFRENKPKTLVLND